jgi:tetratricopeptide (TPR) repeat protein
LNAQGAIFLSYASQDAEAARRIAEALGAAGLEVWFDQSELRGGDAWDQSIRKQIKNCALFMPIISAHTQKRLEGYFRLEWKLAEDRSHLMAKGKAFIVPVTVDGTGDHDAQVPDAFLAVQWTKLPGGEASPGFAERVKMLLGSPMDEAPRQNPAQNVPVVPRRAKNSRLWVGAAGIFAVVLVAIALWHPWSRGKAPDSARQSAGRNPEVVDLVSRALAMTQTSPTFEDPSMEAFEAAGKLLEQAKSIDPTDGEVWAVEAMNDVHFLRMSYDLSPARRQRAAVEAARAAELSPGSQATRLAQAQVLIWVVKTDGSFKEAEDIARKLALETPHDQETLVTLGESIGGQGRSKEAAEFYSREKMPYMASVYYTLGGLPNESLKAIDQALALKRSNKSLCARASILEALEDANAVLEALDQIPQSAYTDEKSATVLMFEYLKFGRYEKVVEIARSYPGDWVSLWQGNNVAPKALMVGQALMSSGRSDAAKQQFALALQLVEQKLRDDPNSEVIYWKAVIHASLGQREQAERSFDLYRQLHEQGGATITWSDPYVLIRIGRGEEVLKWLEEKLPLKDGDARWLHSDARFGVTYAPLRGDPRFEKLLRDTLPPGAKPFDEPAAKAASAPEPAHQ